MREGRDPRIMLEGGRVREKGGGERESVGREEGERE